MLFEKRLKIALILLVVALSFVIIELPHLDTYLPLHPDSYDNIAITQKSIETGTVFLENPYLTPEKSFSQEKTNAGDLQFGYTIILLITTLFGIINPINLPLYFPWIVSLLLFVATFILLKKLCHQEDCAFIGALFVFFIPSSQLMLGPIFLVASNFALLLLPLLLWLGHIAITEKKNQKRFLALLIVSGLIYPPVVIIALLSLLISLVFSPNLLKKNLNRLLKTIVLFGAIFIMYILFLLIQIGADLTSLFSKYGFEFVFAVTDYIFDQLLVKQNFSQEIPFMDSYLGFVLFLFGAVSLIFFAWKFLKYKENSSFLIVYLSAILFSILAFLGLFFGKSILIPTERMVFFASYFLLISAGLFLGKIISTASQKLGFSSKKRICFFVISLIILSFIIVISTPVKTETLTPNITANELSGIDWLKHNTTASDLILAPPYISKAINVLSNRYVVSTSPSRFGSSYEDNKLATSFFFAKCEDKKFILDNFFKADYVVAQNEFLIENNKIIFPEQDCYFLKKLFEQNNIKIYKIQQ